MRGCLGMLCLPALEAGERGLLVRRVRDDDQRHLRVRGFLRRAFGARGRDARRLAVHLAKVRRPRRVAEPGASSRAASSSSFSSEPRASPCRHADRRSRRSASARQHGEIGRVAVGDLVPAERRRDARVGQRAHRVRGASRAVLRVLVVVEEHAVALLLPPLRGRELRARAARSRATRASAARRTSVNVQRGSMRTFTCMPREPLVFGQPRSPSSSRSAFTSSATRRTSSHATPGPGSRSTRSSSGCSRSPARTGCGCSSMQPRFTTHASPAASSTTTSSAVRPEGNDSVTVRSQSGRLSGARFW